jgi:hypothetical protein
MTYTSTRLIATSRINPCPICDDIKGKCRIGDPLVLCMNHADITSQLDHPDYRFTGNSKDGLWGIYAPKQDEALSQADRESYKRNSQAIKQQRSLSEKLQHAQSLDLISRDREYHKLLAQLSLSATDRKDLKQRGLTDEQIELGMYRTVIKWQPLTQTLYYRLAGVSLDGRSLNVSSVGYLVPIFNADGLIVACQIRLRHCDDGRYRWLTSKTKARHDGATPHLPNGELPIGCYRPQELRITDSIGTTEGHLKPFVTSQKLGQIVLGASGGQFGSSPETFKLQLDQASAELGECKIVTDYVDAGAIANPNVMQQLKTKWKLLTTWGYTLRIAWWGQFSKTAPDIDELQDYTLIQYLSVDEFISLENHLLSDPDLTLNQRYLGDLNIPEKVKLLCLKSPKGTGKTESIAKLVEKYLYEMPILVLGHRAQLVQALCDRFGIHSVYEMKDDLGNIIGFGLCVDSLHNKSQARFNPDDWSNALVIVDESEQVIWHTLNSDTEVREQRVTVLSNLQKLFSNVLASDRGLIIVSDADLTNLSLDFVLGMANRKDIKPYIIVNEYSFTEGWNVYTYHDTSPVRWYATLEANLNNGKRVLVHLDSQKLKGKWSGANIETRLREKFPHLKILLLDSFTIGNPNHPAYQAIARGLDRLIALYDVVLCTPVVETGLSLDVQNHFDCVFGCFCGVTGESQTRQALARLRVGVERHIWLKSYGLGRVANGSTSAKSVLISDRKTAKEHIRQLQDSALTNIEINPHPIALLTWAKMAARHNTGLIKFRASVERSLQLEGHCIIVADDQIDTRDLKAEMTANRDRNYQIENAAISQESVITDDEADELKEKKSKTESDRRKLRKFEVAKRYQIPVTPELLAADDSGLYTQLRLHYFLTMGREFLPTRDKAKLAQILKDSQKLWSPDANKVLLGAKIAMLEELKVMDLLNSDREFRGTDADMIELWDRAITKRFAIKSVLGITIKSTDSPIHIAQKLVEKLGLKLTRVSRDKVDGKIGANVYRFIFDPEDVRHQVFKTWLARDIVKISDQGSVIESVITASPNLSLDPSD